MFDEISTFEAILLIALALLPLADLAATIFFAYLFMQSKRPSNGAPIVPGGERTFMTRLLGGRSWLLALLTAAFGIITLVFAFIGFLSGRRLVGVPLAGTAPLVVASLLLLGLIPVVFAIAFYRTRQKHGSPPPFGDRD